MVPLAACLCVQAHCAEKLKYSERLRTLERIQGVNVEFQSQVISLRQRAGDLAEREEVLFNTALDLPVQFRADYLKRACGGDAQLLAQVEDLFQALGQPVGPDEMANGLWLDEGRQPATDPRTRRD
jgi:hypothetical protein